MRISGRPGEKLERMQGQSTRTRSGRGKVAALTTPQNVTAIRETARFGSSILGVPGAWFDSCGQRALCDRSTLRVSDLGLSQHAVNLVPHDDDVHVLGHFDRDRGFVV